MIPRIHQLCMVDPGWDFSAEWKELSERIASTPSRFVEFVDDGINGRRMLWESTGVTNWLGERIQFFTGLNAWTPIVPDEQFEAVAVPADRQLFLFQGDQYGI